MAPYHRPELDETPELDNKGGNYLPRANRDPTLGLQAWAWRWLCCRDTFAAQREGHLQAVSHILDVLKHTIPHWA
jgi:hypothetical protein